MAATGTQSQADFAQTSASSRIVFQSWSRPATSSASACGRCRIRQASGLCADSSIASSSSGLYLTMRPGSSPQLADRITFGLQSSMRVASSLAAKPPNTTEWTAPMRAQASMAITASGIIGM